MPDLDDFIAFQMTTSDTDSGKGKNNNSNNDNKSPNGCTTALIVLAILGWILWFVGKVCG